MMTQTMPYTNRVHLQRRQGDCSKMSYIELTNNPLQLYEQEQE